MDIDASNAHKNVSDPRRLRAGGAARNCLYHQADSTAYRRQLAGTVGIARYNLDRAGGRVRNEGETGVIAAARPDSDNQKNREESLLPLATKLRKVPGKIGPHPTPPDSAAFLEHLNFTPMKRAGGCRVRRTNVSRRYRDNGWRGQGESNVRYRLFPYLCPGF